MRRVPFVWSFSRHRTFERCRRAYWYDYYGSRGGWRSKAAPRTRQLYLLKGLKSVPQFVGIVVHEAAERTLKALLEGRTIDPEATVADTTRLARRAVEDSLAGLYRLHPKKHHGFVAIEYGSATSETWAMAVDDVAEQTRALVEHPIYTRLFDVPERIVEVERLERVHIGRQATWVSLDVLVRDGKGGFVVIDWKTGRAIDPEQVARQVAVYATYVHQRYDVPLSDVRGLMASTRTGSFDELGFSAAAAEEVSDMVHASARKMAERLLGDEGDMADEADFEMLPEGDPICASCRYRRVCDRE